METVVSKDGTIIAFDRYGGGPPLILVSGATATRAAETSLAETMSGDFTVLSYDRRGRGDSGDTLPYAVEREMEDLEALINEAGGSAFVFGHSSGGVLALRAATSGLEILKLAVYEPPFIVDNSRTSVPDDYVAHLELAPIGWQLFILGIFLYDQTASSVSFDTLATRLLAQPLNRELIISLSQGSTIRHVYAATFRDYEVSLPPVEEQTVIAAVLSDMDAEIAALEARREKTRQVKRGMMQELLTGRTRLV